MATPAREISITYNGYAVGGSSGRPVYGWEVHKINPTTAVCEFEFVIAETGVGSAFATARTAAETALSVPRKDLLVTMNSSTLLSWSHGSNTGFDAVAEIHKVGSPQDSAQSIRYKVTITVGVPADWSLISPDLRDSAVSLEFDDARRRRVSIDGIYTASGGSGARAVYNANIATYAAAIHSALGITTYDLLEESANANSTDKVLNFHRRYDELGPADRHDGKISVTYDHDRRRHVVISGTYTTVLLGTSARALYAADIGAFTSAVLTALGGTYDRQSEEFTYDDQTIDKTCSYTLRFDETVAGRQFATISLTWDGARRRHLTLSGKYVSVTLGTSALALYYANFPAFATAALTLVGITNYSKTEEAPTVNDTDNWAEFRVTYDEEIFAEPGGAADPAFANQHIDVDRMQEGPGDTEGATRPTILTVSYSADVNSESSTDIKSKWENTVRPWLVSTIAASYQASGRIAIVRDNFNPQPVENKVGGTLVLSYATSNLLMYHLEVHDSRKPGMVLTGRWSGDPDDYLANQGHAVNTRTVTKTYRRLAGTSTPAATGAGTGTDQGLPTGATGEGGDDPFGFKGMKYIVVDKQQKKAKLKIGVGTSTYEVEDISYINTYQFYRPGAKGALPRSSGGGPP